ncbi:MAG TPA: phage tail sheath family protein [Candidatus Binatia bacterium]|nr:phage tail sheath family protein [Candidatus Binatia bacterium]
MYPGVYVEEIEIGAKPIEGVNTSTAGMVGLTQKGPINQPTLVTSFSEFQRLFGGYLDTSYGDYRYLPHAVEGFFQNGGKRVYINRVDTTDGLISDETIIGKDSGDPTQRTGLWAFNGFDEIKILAVPNGTNQKIQNAMIKHCERLKNCFAVLDPKKCATLDAIRNQRSLYNSSYAALYYPWIKIRHPETGKNLSIPPSGHICGIIARTDLQRGVHKAPANEVIEGVLGPEQQISKAQLDMLNPLGVNCLREFSGRGFRVWGARTTSNDPFWKYINLRRLFVYLEESIEKGTRWVVFEPDNEKLWARVKQIVSQFLTTVWKSGALMGTTPEQAFFVKCDRSTMTQDDIDNGRLVTLIGVAPTKPAEFVIFRIAQWQGGSAATE